MPSNPLETVRALVAAAADDRTEINDALAKGRAACKLIQEYNLLGNGQPSVRPPITLDAVTDAIDAASDFVSRVFGAPATPRRGPRGGRRRRNRYA